MAEGGQVLEMPKRNSERDEGEGLGEPRILTTEDAERAFGFPTGRHRPRLRPSHTRSHTAFLAGTLAW